MELTDEELVRQVQAALEGDTRPFEELVRRHQKKVIANCRYLTRDPLSAEDLAQEVFVKAYFGLRSFEGRSSFRRWLQQVKANHCLNHLKKRQGWSFVDLEDASTRDPQEFQRPPAAERALAEAGDRGRIREILDSMSTSLRVPLLLRDMDELPYEEVAGILGIGLSAAKMRIKRAREEFRRRYRELDERSAPSERAG